MINKVQMTEDQQTDKKLQHCLKCQQFFGRPEQDDLCSKCFKEKNKPETKIVEKPQIPVITEIKEEKETKQEQVDTSKCFKCARKTGIYGYKCKCNNHYCKVHRIPEEHECTYDFKESGKKELEKINVKVVASKLEKF